MYGRMQFADFVVSSALQSLSKSLQRVAGSDGHPLRCSDEKALILTAERILSLWQMAQWSVPKLQFKMAQADLKEIVNLCHGVRYPELAAAQRLLERAESKAGRTLVLIVETLQAEPAAEGFRERLNTLLQAESSRWREYAPLRQIEQIDLIEHGMLRAFDKAEALTTRLDHLAAETGSAHRASAKRLLRTGRWVRHCANHLELLRPALSDSGRTRLWHLARLAVKLEDQWGLERLARLLRPEMPEAILKPKALKPKGRARVEDLLINQRKRLEKQRQKLSVVAFSGSEAVYRREVTAAVEKLGLASISLLPLDAAENRGQRSN